MDKITFKDFLLEAKLVPPAKEHTKINPKFVAFVKKIKAQCGPYIAELKKMQKPGLLVRGVAVDYKAKKLRDFSKNDSMAGAKQSRPSRRPMDTDIATHYFIDNYFKEKFGWKARSEHTVFCYNNVRASLKNDNNYGSFEAFIFPKGPLQYVYSPKVDDLYTKAEHVNFSDAVVFFIGNDPEYIENSQFFDLLHDAFSTDLQEDLVHFMFQTEHLRTSIYTHVRNNTLDSFLTELKQKLRKSTHPHPKNICSKYLEKDEKQFDKEFYELIDAAIKQEKKLFNKAKTEINSFMDKLKYTNTDLYKVVESPKLSEIMLHTKDYFYIGVEDLAKIYLTDDRFNESDLGHIELEKMLWKALVNDEV